uniref:Knottin scorpion toxin-like domain-containing protein n=1 Tax=Oryza punctata TaxID=4537 RepID=A0A0E0LSX8_ORYPU
MEGRKASVFFILLLVLALGGSVSATDYCYKAIGKLIVCVGPTCKLDCWLEAKYNKARVKVHKCMKHGLFAKCYCEICTTF